MAASMFGAFKPTGLLSVGLLWKNPWRLSAPRKLRHRRRLRRIDNVITVLDTALRRRQALTENPFSTFQPAKGSSSSSSSSSSSFQSHPSPKDLSLEGARSRATASDPFSATVQARTSSIKHGAASPTATSTSISTATPAPRDPALQLRSGRGPKRGDLLPPYPIGTDKGLAGAIRTTGQVALELGTIKALERWKADMPLEAEMLARDKYTMFDRKERGYRKSVHKGPKWTRTSQRLNPPGY